MRNPFPNCWIWLRRCHRPRRNVNLLVVGIDNAGKSTTVASIQRNPTDGMTPTIGFDSSSFRLRRCNVTLYDLGGGSRIRGIWKNYYAEVHGVVFVVDASDAERMGETREVLEEVVKDTRMRGKPVLVLANKNDVDGAMDEIDVCNQLRVRELMEQEQFDCQVEQCAALKGRTDRAIMRGMKWLLDSVSKDYDALGERVVADMTVQREEEAREKKERAERVRKLREERRKQEEAAGVKEAEDEDDGEMQNPFVPVNEHLRTVEQRGKETECNPESAAEVKKPEQEERARVDSSSSSDGIVIGKPMPPPVVSSPVAASVSNGSVRHIEHVDPASSTKVIKPKKKKKNVRKNKVGVMDIDDSQTGVSLPPIRGLGRPVWARSDSGVVTDLPPSELQYVR